MVTSLLAGIARVMIRLAEGFKMLGWYAPVIVARFVSAKSAHSQPQVNVPTIIRFAKADIVVIGEIFRKELHIRSRPIPYDKRH